MSFIPNHSSTPKFVSVLHQPAHFILAQPGRRISFENCDEEIPTRTISRPLRKRRTKQSNISTAINRQYYFRDESRDEKKQASSQILFCLPLRLFRRRRRHGPCHV